MTTSIRTLSRFQNYPSHVRDGSAWDNLGDGAFDGVNCVDDFFDRCDGFVPGEVFAIGGNSRGLAAGGDFEYWDRGYWEFDGNLAGLQYEDNGYWHTRAESRGDFTNYFPGERTSSRDMISAATATSVLVSCACSISGEM